MKDTAVIESLQRLRPLLLKLASVLLPRGEEAEDVVQDVQVRMWLLRERFDNELALSRMAHVSVRNAALNIRKKKRLARASFGVIKPENIPVSEESPHTHLARKEAVQQIEALMEALPTRGRAFLQMRADGLTYAEIADICGTTEVNIRSQVCRARQWLLEQLKRND